MLMKNQIYVYFDNSEQLMELIQSHESYPTYVSGKNENGEDTELSIGKSDIVLRTFQSNHHVRVNYFDENGKPAGETFDGRW